MTDPAPAKPLDPGTVLYPRGDGPAASAKPPPPMTGLTAAILVVVAGAVAGWLLWRRVRGHGPAGKGEQKLSIAETKSLGNRQYLVVASYGARKFLIGVCPGKIDLLSALPSAEDEAHSPGPAPASTSSIFGSSPHLDKRLE